MSSASGGLAADASSPLGARFAARAGTRSFHSRSVAAPVLLAGYRLNSVRKIVRDPRGTPVAPVPPVASSSLWTTACADFASATRSKSTRAVAITLIPRR